MTFNAFSAILRSARKDNFRIILNHSGMAEIEAENPLLGQITCGSLLQQLQQIWDEVGETDEARDKMLLQLEQECLDVYKRKVDHAVKSRVQLLQTLADARVELTNLVSALGEKSYVGIVANSVPRVVHPDWLHKKVREKDDKFRQRKLVDIFSRKQKDDDVGVGVNLEANDQATLGNNVSDMEDFRNIGKTSVWPQPVVRSFEINKEQHQVETSTSVENPEQNDSNGNGLNQATHPLHKVVHEDSIDKAVDYQGWLELRKRKWKETREKRKRQRLDNSRTSNPINSADAPHNILNYKHGGRVGVNSYFQRHDLALTRCHWQIVQLEPSGLPGQCFVWVLVGGVMRKIPLLITRILRPIDMKPFPTLCMKTPVEGTSKAEEDHKYLVLLWEKLLIVCFIIH